MIKLTILVLSILGMLGCSSDSSDPIPEPPIEEPGGENGGENSPPDDQLTDAELLDLAQSETFKYFWDYANAESGAAKERYIPANPTRDQQIVASGGTGFGLMGILVGIERNFISRTEGFNRLSKIINFLEGADRFHGAWPHWINGTTGAVIPFSTLDDGADLVETSFVAQGLITVGEYFKNGSSEEQDLAQKAFELIDGIEWNWFTQGENVLYWHWSPDNEFAINLRLQGYNETLITYVMAAASKDFSIAPEVYNQGWAQNGGIKSSAVAYGYPLEVKHAGAEQTGGPLFWAHYSYLGLNPFGLSDAYVNYETATVNHTLSNYAYCVENPKNWPGYGSNLWGLTASYTINTDGSLGYTAHSPGNDTGVITPTAALSSFPYTPEKSMAALRRFYELENILLGPAGFYDAFSPAQNYEVAEAYLAIDQGPILVMIENHRSGLLWRLFMQNERVQAGLDKLNFTYTVPQ
ncbi:MULTISPECIES: glucoamylase family protein [unclassified Leeuwenhoekiella]|uniref:glucoamylase family protein n=1 Tax=unclassified Leeuwenhoekiella TaxID=2615029 RepID=UPI000C59EF5C|nr:MULTISPECIES: glucoamylase family protein [unclassified Leeuwenhoekiella]MAW94236.1 beta-glucosidase [Leeuwenhoekiella sp.]MAW96850.1 beta-glucosidase [Leeuwenhoekiella sp.]MBA80348.1 beta-glucosidase [Leeuwenhoekiella sp.]|tara:strand:+ start:35343 stop:36743 length:1401 start_codon:yes stop_codon:yes gene_type:complete